MPEDILKSTTNEHEKTTSEKTDALLSLKQDILQSFGKAKNDVQSIQKLEDSIKPIQENIDQKTADSIIQNLSKEKGRLQSLNMNFEDFIKNSSVFINKKILNFEDVSISDMKTYLEQKNKVSNRIINIKDTDNNTIKNQINIGLDKKESINKEVILNDNESKNLIIAKEQQADQILSNIDQKLATQKDQITSLPAYQAEKTLFEEQLNTKIDDSYFVTRFALQHINEPNAYLTQADLGGMKQEDLIARLNEKYNVREVISLQDKTFQNNTFDGRVSGATRQEITTKGGSFETVFTAAELEFFKPDSQLRNNLTGIVQGGIFPGEKDATADKPYWNGEKDYTSWIPKDALQNEQSFFQWMKQNNVPNADISSLTTYYAKTFKVNRNKPQNDLSPAEKKLQYTFLQNIALVESTKYRNTIKETSTKAIAENIFADIASMTGNEIAGSSDRKLIKQTGSNDYFTMDKYGEITLKYELNDMKGDIVIDKDGGIKMGPVLTQEKGFSDIISAKLKVGQIKGVTKYIGLVDNLVNKPGNTLKTLSSDRLAAEIRKTVSRDIVSSDVTKASMQTNIARQSMFDTILLKTNSQRTNDIKLDISKSSNKPLIKGIDTNDFSRMILLLYDYSKISSKSQIETVTKRYKMLQEYLDANPSFSENQNIKDNPEHLATILNRFPIEKRSDIKIMRDKQLKEEKAKIDIDHELAELEQKIDNNFT